MLAVILNEFSTHIMDDCFHVDAETDLSLMLLASGDRDHILSGVFNQFLSEKSEPAE